MTPNPSDADVKALLAKYRRIAVVGLSDRPDRPSYGVAEYLKNAGYDITPVNPQIDEWLGTPAADTLQDASPPLEIVDVFRRPEHVPEVIDDAIAADAKLIWLQSGIVNEEAAQKARDAGIAVVQDRCLRVEHRRLFGNQAPDF
jgi:uncharacterized protein